jgi:hypothetical protein
MTLLSKSALIGVALFAHFAVANCNLLLVGADHLVKSHPEHMQQIMGQILPVAPDVKVKSFP